MQCKNEMNIKFLSLSSNESFARTVAAAFIAQLDPTLEEIADIKTAVSEAVTNAIIHGYENQMGYVTMVCKLFDNGSIFIEISDEGKGIEDVNLARQPLFTSKPELERSGMGFTVMESFMDRVDVESLPGKGTKVSLYKTLSSINREKAIS